MYRLTTFLEERRFSSNFHSYFVLHIKVVQIRPKTDPTRNRCRDIPAHTPSITIMFPCMNDINLKDSVLYSVSTFSGFII